MAGLSRFDFYPRDWHLDTRDLTNAAKGVYVDLLASMYARGGPLPMEERELCRLCGCATARSLRPLLSELIAKGKLHVENGYLVNHRTMEEIAKAERRRDTASEGGKAKAEAELQRVQREFSSNTRRTQPETWADIEEIQRDNACSPSPSPSKKNILPSEGAVPAHSDPKKELYDLGSEVLGTSSGGQVTKLLRHHAGNIGAAMQTLRLAASKSDARRYIAGLLRGDPTARADDVLSATDELYREIGVSL